MLYFLLIIVGTFILWYFIGRVIVTLICVGFNFSAFKEEWDYAGILEKLCSIIWPFTLIVFIIDTIKE